MSGRVKLPAKRRLHVHVYVAQERTLRAIAKRQRVTLAQVIRDAVEAYIEREGAR